MRDPVMIDLERHQDEIDQSFAEWSPELEEERREQFERDNANQIESAITEEILDKGFTVELQRALHAESFQFDDLMVECLTTDKEFSKVSDEQALKIAQMAHGICQQIRKQLASEIRKDVVSRLMEAQL